MPAQGKVTNHSTPLCRGVCMVQVLVNGAPQEFPVGTTVSDVVLKLVDNPRGIAVAVNSEVVPRGAWSSVTVEDESEILVITAAQGG